jgi:hypothetical protein
LVDLSKLKDGKDFSDKSGKEAQYVLEFLSGYANEFIVKPTKISDAVVLDAPLICRQDSFFSELWTSECSIVDSSCSWYSDGSIACHNPVQYEYP